MLDDFVAACAFAIAEIARHFGARLFVEFASSGKREAVGGRLHLRLQAHAARAVEGQEGKADQNRQHHRHIGDHQSIRVAPQRKSAPREMVSDS